MRDELKPCPFCGGKATMTTHREHVISCASPNFCFGKTSHGFAYPEDAARHWNTRQAQAQGSEGVDRESLVREVIDLARKLEPWDGKTFNEELHAKLRKLVAAHAQAGEGSNGA